MKKTYLAPHLEKEILVDEDIMAVSGITSSDSDNILPTESVDNLFTMFADLDD